MTGTCGQGLDTGFVALGYGKVAALGVVQGITELMPVSSSAHITAVAVGAKLEVVAGNHFLSSEITRKTGETNTCPSHFPIPGPMGVSA
jgi:hypothetical protein